MKGSFWKAQINLKFIWCYQTLKGKSKSEVISILGNDFFSEYNGEVWVYFLGKNLFKRNGIPLWIEFDEEDIVRAVFKMP